MMVDGQHTIYEFGPFSLDPREHRLLFGNEVVALTPKAFETLAALVERSGHVVTKDELMRLVWRDSFVEESGLTRNISVLRKELEDRFPGGKDLIETVPKVGYRFNAPVLHKDAAGSLTHSNGSSEQPARGRPQVGRWLTVFLLGVIVVLGIVGYRYRPITRESLPDDSVQRSTLAVLPFRSLAKPAEDIDLQIGIADALISKLSNLKNLTLKPTSAVRKYAESPIDPQSAGRELGVDAVVDGSIQREGDRIIVSVQLVRVGDGASVWAQRFEDRTTDMFSIQDAIAERIIAALQIKMDADEQSRLFRRYTENAQAFDAYVRGRSLLSEYTRESTLGALALFEEALKFDPNYALARNGLATASAEMFLRFASEAESEGWGRRADDEIAKALELDPNLAETHQALAAVYRKKDFNWERVLEESERALELNPSLEQPHYYQAAAFYHLGLLDAARTETELATRINPQNRIDGLRSLGVIALYEGRYADAIAYFEEVQRLSSRPIADSHLVLAYFYNGDALRAEQLASELSKDPSRSASTRAKAALASFVAARGDGVGAAKLLDWLETRESVDHHAAYSISCAYAQLHNNKKALYWLRRAASTGLACLPLFERDKLLDPISSDPDFRDFLDELRQTTALVRQRYVKSEQSK